MENPKINIARYLDQEGRIVQLPKKKAVCTAVYGYLAEKFQPERIYTEKEVNALCDQWHTFTDYFVLRRGMVDAGFLLRKQDGSQYWRSQEPTP